MRGFRTRESASFEEWFASVQDMASKRGCVYFADSGEGHSLVTDTIDIEDLSGWMIPNELAPEFEIIWAECHDAENGLYDSPWGDYYTFVEWKQDEDGTIHTFFKKYDDYGNELTI